MITNLQFFSKLKILTLLFISISFYVSAQTDITEVQDEKKSLFSSFDLGADFKSRYIWRGINLGGNTVSIQPYVEYNFAKGFVAGIWGAYSIGVQTNQEVDIYIGYTSPNEKFSFLLTDYFFPDYSIRDNNYFDYDDSSGHVYELMASFNFFEDFPLGFSVATNFYGADKKIDSEGEPTDKQSFSTYLEANYSTSIATVDLSFFAGAVFANEGGYYGEYENAFINLGFTASKTIKITERFGLPIDASLIFNPSHENVFFVFGISI